MHFDSADGGGIICTPMPQAYDLEQCQRVTGKHAEKWLLKKACMQLVRAIGSISALYKFWYPQTLSPHLSGIKSDIQSTIGME